MYLGSGPAATPDGTRAVSPRRCGQSRLAAASPSGELAAWRALGYTGVPVVQAAGQYSRRGGIVDVFPAGAPWPVRIELVGSEIESLRQFDPATQSRAPAQSSAVGPLHPFLLPRSTALAELQAIDMTGASPTSRCSGRTI